MPDKNSIKRSILSRRLMSLWISGTKTSVLCQKCDSYDAIPYSWHVKKEWQILPYSQQPHPISQMFTVERLGSAFVNHRSTIPVSEFPRRETGILQRHQYLLKHRRVQEHRHEYMQIHFIATYREMQWLPRRHYTCVLHSIFRHHSAISLHGPFCAPCSD